MKKPGIIFILLLSSVFSLAQVQRVPAKSADSASNKSPVNTMDKARKKDMMKDLDLTKEQRSKLKDIRQSGKAKKEAIESDDKLSDQEKKNQLRAIQKEQAQNIQTILTEEQKAKFKANRQAQNNKQ